MRQLLFLHWDILLLASMTDGAPRAYLPGSIAQAVTDLIEDGLLEASESQVQITEEGRRMIGDNPEQLDATILAGH